jgi:uncharacterized membrane-anchored protein YhcB (DUF1043 family)
MKNSNKKLGIYIGIGLVVGAIGFIAYTKITSNKLPNTKKLSNTEDDSTLDSNTNVKNPFSSNNPKFSNQLNIKTPAIAFDLTNAFK